MLNDRERQELDDIERGLSSRDPVWSRRFGARQGGTSSTEPVDLAAEAYAVLAVISGVFAVLFVTRWPGFSVMLLVMAAINWKIGVGDWRPSQRPHRSPPD